MVENFKTGIRRSNDELEKFKRDKLANKFVLREQPNFKGDNETLEYMQFCERMYMIGKPVISDTEWDEMVKNSGYIESLGIVESASGRRYTTIKAPLVSLKKCCTYDDIKKFYEEYKDHEFLIEPKFDGLTFNATYRKCDDGRYFLDNVGTRGDGLNSLLLNQNALFGVVRRGLPDYIDIDKLKEIVSNSKYHMSIIDEIESDEYFQIRGEAFVRKSDYSNKADSYWNDIVPRSIAAGIFNRKESKNYDFFIKSIYEKIYPLVKSGATGGEIQKATNKLLYKLDFDTKNFNHVIKFDDCGKFEKILCIARHADKTSFELPNEGNYIKQYFKVEHMDFVTFSIASGKYGNIDDPVFLNSLKEANNNEINTVMYYSDHYFDGMFNNVVSSLKEICNIIDKFYGADNFERNYEKFRYKSNTDIPVDGIVLKIADSNNATQGLSPRRKSNGEYVVPHHPVDQIAIKLPTDPVKTRINKIVYKETNLGNTTVSCEVEPVIAEGGTLVKNVNLHNPKWLALDENKWIKEGVECYLRLSQDIIPIISPIE